MAHNSCLKGIFANRCWENNLLLLFKQNFLLGYFFVCVQNVIIICIEIASNAPFTQLPNYKNLVNCLLCQSISIKAFITVLRNANTLQQILFPSHSSSISGKLNKISNNFIVFFAFLLVFLFDNKVGQLFVVLFLYLKIDASPSLWRVVSIIFTVQHIKRHKRYINLNQST